MGLRVWWISRGKNADDIRILTRIPSAAVTPRMHLPLSSFADGIIGLAYGAYHNPLNRACDVLDVNNVPTTRSG